MEQELKKKSFNRRAFVSIVMFFAGLCLSISGIMNHKLQFGPLTVERHFWMSVHNVAAMLFTIFAIVHISYNWRVLIHYTKRAKEISLSKEAIAAFALVIVLVGIFSLHAFHAG